MMFESSLIITLLHQVDNITKDFVFHGYEQLVNTYKPAIFSLVTLSVIIYGYGAALGWISLSLAETSKRLLTVGFVLSFALNWGTFSFYVYDLFTNAPNEISSALISTIHDFHYADVNDVNTALQEAWRQGMSFFVALWEKGGFNNIVPYLWAIVVLILMILLVGVSLIELIVAKFGLAIFLVIAPLTIPMLLFKPTKEVVFDGWLKHVIGFALVPVFVTSALALGLTLISDSVKSIQQAIEQDALTVVSVAPYVLLIFISLGLVIKAAHMAASIASGFSAAMSPYVAHSAHSMGRHVKAMIPGRTQIISQHQIQPMAAAFNPSTMTNTNNR